MKVLMFVLRLDADDDTNAIYHDYALKLAKKVEKLHVVCLEKGKVSLPKNVSVLHLGKDKGNSKFKIISSYQKYLWKHIRDIDVIYCVKNPPFTMISAPIAKLFRVPIVTWYGHLQVTAQMRIMNFLTDIGISSDPTAYRIKTKKAHFIGHGINTDLFKPSNKKKPNTIIWVGRLSAVRKLELLVEAARILVFDKKVKDLKIIICGENTQSGTDYKKQIQNLVKKYKLSKYFEFPGWVPNKEITKYYSNSKLSVSMVELGGTGKTNMEAMASGLPLVNCSKSLDKNIKKYRNELFFKPDDSKDLAEKLYIMIKLPQTKINEIGKYLRSVMVKEFGMNGFLDRLIKVFKLAIKKKS